MRAADLDATERGGLTIGQLREVAQEAGIDPAAFASAMRELQDELEALTAEPRVSVPWWVKRCMLGVPDRAAAKGYYWLFLVLMLLSPGIVLLAPSHGAGLAFGLALMSFWGFALWSTSAAMRWLDRNGWDLLG